jgi:hypothetical protein
MLDEAPIWVKQPLKEQIDLQLQPCDMQRIPFPNSRELQMPIPIDDTYESQGAFTHRSVRSIIGYRFIDKNDPETRQCRNAYERQQAIARDMEIVIALMVQRAFMRKYSKYNPTPPTYYMCANINVFAESKRFEGKPAVFDVPLHIMRYPYAEIPINFVRLNPELRFYCLFLYPQKRRQRFRHYLRREWYPLYASSTRQKLQTLFDTEFDEFIGIDAATRRNNGEYYNITRPMLLIE